MGDGYVNTSNQRLFLKVKVKFNFLLKWSLEKKA